jgi:hypothetical protein
MKRTSIWRTVAVGLVTAAAVLGSAASAGAAVRIEFGPTEVAQYTLWGDGDLSMGMQKQVDSGGFEIDESYDFSWPDPVAVTKSWAKRTATVKLRTSGIDFDMRFVARGPAFLDRSHCLDQPGVLKGRFVLTRFKKDFQTIRKSSLPAHLVKTTSRTIPDEGCSAERPPPVRDRGGFPPFPQNGGFGFASIRPSADFKAGHDIPAEGLKAEFGVASSTTLIGELQVLAKPAGRVSLSDDAKNGTITGFGPFSGTLSYVGSETGQDGCSPFSRGSVSGTLTAHWDLLGDVEAVSDGQGLTAGFSNFCG